MPRPCAGYYEQQVNHARNLPYPCLHKSGVLTGLFPGGFLFIPGPGGPGNGPASLRDYMSGHSSQELFVIEYTIVFKLSHSMNVF